MQIVHIAHQEHTMTLRVHNIVVCVAAHPLQLLAAPCALVLGNIATTSPLMAVVNVCLATSTTTRPVGNLSMETLTPTASKLWTVLALPLRSGGLVTDHVETRPA